MLPQFRLRLRPQSQIQRLRRRLRLRQPWQSFSSKPSIPDLPLFRALRGHDPSTTAVVASSSTFRYGDLLRDVVLHRQGQGQGDRGGSLNGRRVAFLMENDYDYVGESVQCPVVPLSHCHGGITNHWTKLRDSHAAGDPRQRRHCGPPVVGVSGH